MKDTLYKVGERVLLNQECWYEPYRGKILEIKRIDSDGDYWFDGDSDDYRKGICVHEAGLDPLESNHEIQEAILLLKKNGYRVYKEF